MELSSVFITPKRKRRTSNTSSSSFETSPGEKRWKQSISLASVSGKSNGSDKIVEAVNLTEGVNVKLDIILLKLITLDSKLEELKLTVKVTPNLRGCPSEKNSYARCLQGNPHKLDIKRKVIKCKSR